MRLRFIVLLAVAAGALAAASPAAAAPVGTLDASCTPSGPGGSTPFWSGSSAAQTFTAGASGKVRYVDVKGVFRNAGSTGEPIDVELLGVDGSGAPVTPALSTTSIPGATITAGVEQTLPATFDAGTAHHVAAGTTYAIALSTADTASNDWLFHAGGGCPGSIYHSPSPGAPFGAALGGADAGLDVYLGPANDDFARATVLNGSTATVGGTTLGAASESGDPTGFGDCSVDCGTSAGRSVWYRWTAPGSGPTTIDTCTSGYDSLLGVYRGSGLGSLTQVASANNGCPSGFGDTLSFNATRGTTYRIDVDGCCGAPEGTFTLALAGPAAPPPSPPPPAGDDDTTAPETTIDSGPKRKTKKKKATFEFRSSESGSSFECSLDGGAFASCTSPHGVKAKKKGRHGFEVRAIDEAGNSDQTPAAHAWKLKKKKKR